MKKKSLLYFQSGGPTSVINTSLYGVITEAKKHPEIDGIYGAIHGIEGVLNDRLIDLRAEDEETVELLKQTPGAALGSARYKLSNDIHDDDYKRIVEVVKKHNIGYLLVNGGNDSMDTCTKLSKLFKEIDYDCNVMGIPKTIDNDLYGLDHSLGFPSAAKYVAQSLQDIQIDNLSYDKGKVLIVEVMGRHTGWLTAAAVMLPEELRPDRIYFPEEDFDIDEFGALIKEKYEEKGKAFIVISEGVDANIPSEDVRVDSFGHKQLGGLASELGSYVQDKFDVPVRAVEFSLMQRAGVSHITKVDQNEAIRISRKAVRSVLKDSNSGKMVALKRGVTSTGKYKSTCYLQKASKVANVERKLPEEFIDDIHNGNGDLMREYLAPLIEDGIKLDYENGITKYAKLKKVSVE